MIIALALFILSTVAVFVLLWLDEAAAERERAR
jgi:uncharacterized membrane protein YsdA (DUF1294 family)